MNEYDKIDLAEHLFLLELFEPEQNELEFILTIGEVSPIPEDIYISEIKLGLASKVEINEDEKYVVKFSSYISYNVINESFGYSTNNTFKGKKIRVYPTSNFLDYISKDTCATEDYPGKFKHFSFITENHIVNVISTKAPTIYKLE